MMKEKRIFSSIACILLLATLSTSCVNTKRVAYFNNIPDTNINTNDIEPESIIQKGDLLSISVSNMSPEASVIFNMPNTPVTSPGVATQSQYLGQAVGYLVDQDGNIQFPMLGNIKAQGLSKKDLKDTITNRLIDRKLLFDPIVNIRYLNFHVTVLGEVGHPGTITLPNEQVTILEAIGMAGDLTIYGKRENVLLIRKNGEKKEVRRLDLSSDKILYSPYFYLKTNDVIYVEPGRNKIASASRSQQLLPYILSGLTIVAIVLDHVIK